MIIRPDPAKFCSTHEIDFSSRTHEPLLSLPPSLQPTFRFTFFGQGRSIGGVWQSRINGDLIKDYSWTKIKINLTPAAEETNKRGSRRGCDVEAVCSSTSRPMALIIRWRQMEREEMRTYTHKETGMEAFFLLKIPQTFKGNKKKGRKNYKENREKTYTYLCAHRYTWTQKRRCKNLRKEKGGGGGGGAKEACTRVKEGVERGKDREGGRKRLPKGVILWPTTSTTLHSVETHDIRKTRSRTTTKILAPSG